jgi:hypothetical protein
MATHFGKSGPLFTNFTDNTITVKYSCHTCGLERVELNVKARGDEDVITWMNSLGPQLAADHKKHSPKCNAQSVQDLMIPVTGADKIGGVKLN